MTLPPTLQTNGASQPLWLQTGPMPSYPALQGDAQADVCVIGGGLAGLSTAYLLAKAGQRVVLVEALSLGAGESGRTTAHWMPTDDRYAEIERSFGREAAAQVAQSFAAATDLAEAIVHEENIDGAFKRVDGYLYCLPGQNLRVLDDEHDAALRAGIPVDLVDGVPGLSFDTGPALRFPNQAQFHPTRYMAGLARACESMGVRLHCATRASSIESADGLQSVTCEAEQGQAQGQAQGEGQTQIQVRVQARSVVVATHTPFNDRVVMHTKQSGYRTYVLTFEVPRGSVPEVLLWDVSDYYYYVRLDGSDQEAATDLLIVGGADHKVGQQPDTAPHYQQIEQWVRERFPMAGAVRHAWSGQVMEPADGVAYLGRNPMDSDDVYVITGDSGTGMTHCTIGAMVVSDLILGMPNAWTALYDPARKATHALGEFVKEQANTLARYKELLGSGDAPDAAHIEPGQGMVLRHGLKPLAVYRDEQSQLHVRSALCTHLGCVVHWNPAEKSWDCPCHASRFAIDGQVLHGPAATPLAAAELPGQGR